MSCIDIPVIVESGDNLHNPNPNPINARVIV